MLRTALALLLIGTVPAGASCYRIRDQDMRQLCLARERSSNNPCFQIRDHDLESACRAEQGGGLSQCLQIRNPDEQALCRAGLR